MGLYVRFCASLAYASAAALALQVASQEAHASEAGSSAGVADVIHGYARVVDGDTLDIAGKRVRLEGIDAPEIKQFCPDGGNRQWPAGRVAAASLVEWTRGRRVTCRRTGHDGYGRALAHCRVGNLDLNAALIDSGLAWAFRKYSQRYVNRERSARAAGVGVWARNCQPAWAFRANRWRAVAGAAPAGCAIKGNITRGGRIYHMPWSPWYGRTRIELAKGERWFCDERQALAAGWRPAFVR